MSDLGIAERSWGNESDQHNVDLTIYFSVDYNNHRHRVRPKGCCSLTFWQGINQLPAMVIAMYYVSWSVSFWLVS